MTTSRNLFRLQLRIAATALLLLFFRPIDLHAQDEPRFFIESIRVLGASRTAASIVLAEAAISLNAPHSENELRASVSRVQRLPFVVACEFRLERGTAVERYVLVIQVHQMKPLFASADSTVHWELTQIYDRTSFPLRIIGTSVDQVRTDQLLIGTRLFVGTRGVANLTAERVSARNDRYTATFTEYDLFGTRASITGAVSYLLEPGKRHSGDPQEIIDWHHRDNLTFELIGVVPIGPNDSLRGSWQHQELPIGYFAYAPELGRLRYRLLSLPDIRKQISWSHDTTDDPLLTTSGSRISAALIRSSLPSSGYTTLGRRELKEWIGTAQRSWPIASAQALTIGGSHHDYESMVRIDRIFGAYAIDLAGRERVARAGDFRLELTADRTRNWFRHGDGWSDSTVNLALVHRSVWGVLRLGIEYEGWRHP